MKTIKDVMTTDVVWVSPSARVKTAVILIKGHNIGALPVVAGSDSVVGLVTRHNLLGESDDVAVKDLMEPDFATIEPSATVYDAAQTINESRATHLLVMEDDRLVGLVSRSDLMPELGKTFDPLTELPWSDAFRDWAMDALKQSREISVILFDLDLFGRFNKKYGHVIGDTVLKEVAKVLKSGVDNETDLLCRYGGDEFGIVSVRHADDAIALANGLKEAISKIRIEGVPEGVSGTYGMFGGRRTKEREDIHYAATIDDLITRASKECIAHKPHKLDTEKPGAAAEPTAQAASQTFESRGARLKIANISISTTDTEAVVSVALAREGREFRRQASGYVVGGRNVLRLVAEAAAAAAGKSLAPGHGIAVDTVTVHDLGEQDQLVTVVATFISPKWSTRHAGSAVVKRGDQYRAAAAALLSAVNRLLESAPQSVSDGNDMADGVDSPRHEDTK